MEIKYYNLDKLERARKLAGVGASEEKVLESYAKLGGKFDVVKIDSKPVKEVKTKAKKSK